MPLKHEVQPSVDRRHLLGSAAALAAGALWHARARAEDRPPVTQPRATSGDAGAQPDWAERLTITVGAERGDLIGRDQRVLQSAVDYVAGLGGGTVKILPGTYRLRNAVRLRSNVRLVGAGADTILLKEPSHATKLAADSDWFDQEITLLDAAGFQLGDGICLQTKDPHNGGPDVLKRTLVARSGNRFRLDRPLRENFWLMGDTTCTSLFALLEGEPTGGDEISNVVIENLTLDGNREQNENLNGNFAGCIFLQDASRITIRGVTARNNNGDGISWQICHDVMVEDCHSHGHAGLGLHPGSGSQRPVIRNNRLERNDIGIFFCWGVKYGLAEKNTLTGNRLGISIGHRDTDNLICHNEIRDSGECGVLYRPERGPAFAPHGNRLEENTIVNTGDENAAAIDLQGASERNVLARNVIREERSPGKRVGIRISAETRELELVDNRVSGFATAVDDRRGTAK